MNKFFLWHSPLIEYCNPYHKFSGICKPEECWNGLPKYCYKKEIHVVMVSFAVVFGLLGFCFWLKIFQNFNWQMTFVHAHQALHLGLGFIMEKGFHKKNIYITFFFFNSPGHYSGLERNWKQRLMQNLGGK